MTTSSVYAYDGINQKEYDRRIWAWTMYDWANSAFATTILGAVLPVYFSQVAGATLPSATIATAYWSYGLSISLFVIAILSPILGTISDVMRGKKAFLAFFAGLGVISTALLVLVSTGDWILASILGIFGRIGFNGANIFYDALLPHIARREDQDRVSTRGYAMGYLGGGLLLAVNVAMIQLIPGTWGARLSFLSVAIWWAVFSIPILRRVPEPPMVVSTIEKGKGVIAASFDRLGQTIRDIRQYKELFKYLISFLIYNDGIGTIIGVAAIYGAELGFGSVELILALLLVQFVGIPYSLVFGRLPSQGNKRRPFYLAFVLFNIISLPLLGIIASRTLPVDLTGASPEPFTNTTSAYGEGLYSVQDNHIIRKGGWEAHSISAKALGTEEDKVYISAMESGTEIQFSFNGQKIRITHSLGPDHGIWQLTIDGKSVIDPDTGEPLVIDAYNPTLRYEVSKTVQADTAGEHVLSLVNSKQKNPLSSGNLMQIADIEVLPGIRRSNLGIIIGMILGLQAFGLALAYFIGPLLFSKLAEKLNTKRSIILSLSIYTVIAIWGYFLNSVVEFWTLAWMVAIVQGGSQALSRSLYAALSPASKSGEFFGLFGVMEKFSAIIGPLMFATAGMMFKSSRPAVLSLVLLFLIGIYLLTWVNVDEGKRVAQNEDAVAQDAQSS